MVLSSIPTGQRKLEQVRKVGLVREVGGKQMFAGKFSKVCRNSFATPLSNVRALMIVWRMRAKIIRTVLCCIVYQSNAQSYNTS